MKLTNVLFAVATRIFVIVEISGAASSWSELSSRYDHHNNLYHFTNLLLIAGYLELGLSQDRKPSGAGSQKNEAHIPPLLGVAPLGIVPLSKEHQFQYRSEKSCCIFLAPSGAQGVTMSVCLSVRHKFVLKQ